MEFDLKEVIIISEYVRAGALSTPNVKTINLINEYLHLKDETICLNCGNSVDYLFDSLCEECNEEENETEKI